MTREEQIKKVYDYVEEHSICVIATADLEGMPQAATMRYSEDGMKLIFQTPNHSRKFKNLHTNPNVAIVIGWDLEEFTTVQIEGVVKEVDDAEVARIREIHITKNKESKPYAYLPENKYFLVTPKWIRYSDLKGNEKFELLF